MTLTLRRLSLTQAQRVAYLNALREIVGRRMPQNIVSDFDLLNANEQEHEEALNCAHGLIPTNVIPPNDIDAIRDQINAQGQHGNWNFNEYMLGKFNGLEYALSILEHREPKYRHKPADGWQNDKTD